ncbi:MAG: bifunctional nuclease family protein [Mediterranea sp.]|jgi:bifunctional DNase/RNase|nr:bifunctional nuclease family protein [Mediterranea sp.]
MDKTVELQVINITNSQEHAGAFAMLLGDLDGGRQLPIIIGTAEAQAIGLYLKGIEAPRPLTHDLFIATLNLLKIRLVRVLIYEASEGIFYSYIYLEQGTQFVRIDARTSDAVALAVRANCPILINESVLNRECLHFTEDEKDISNEEKQPMDDEEELSDEETLKTLEELLKQAIIDENYELAANIRDRLKTLKKEE